MGSDPQYAKYPDLSLAQHIFTLTNPSSPQTTKQTSLQKLQDGISEYKMAPLYRYLAHPIDGILNVAGEGTARNPAIPNSRKPSAASSMIARRRGSNAFDFPWDNQLYEKLKAENEEELQTLQKEEEEAEEKAGETEVQEAQGKRAEFWARVGDQVSCRVSRMMGRQKRLTRSAGESNIILRSSLREHWCPGHKNRHRTCYTSPPAVLRRQIWCEEER